MPARSLVRIKTSTSRNGNCKTNLRGTRRTSSTLYDYVNPDREITYGADLDFITTSGAPGNWANTIPTAFQNTNAGGDATITYPSVVSTATTGTLLFRMYIEFQDTPPGVQTIFNNGNPGGDGYSVKLVYESSEYNIYFANNRDSQGDWEKINTSALPVSTWIQFSINFETQFGSTEINAYQDGTSTILRSPLNTALVIPTTGTSLLSFYGRITDFALIDESLFATQLAAFGSAPYV